jgi:hypothetical protein
VYKHLNKVVLQNTPLQNKTAETPKRYKREKHSIVGGPRPPANGARATREMPHRDQHPEAAHPRFRRSSGAVLATRPLPREKCPH